MPGSRCKHPDRAADRDLKAAGRDKDSPCPPFGGDRKAAAAEGGKVQALVYHSQVVPAMEALRAPVDQLEMIVDKELWPMPVMGIDI